jgi:radical SAM protein with 4Fe4S-binding SPASM domain
MKIISEASEGILKILSRFKKKADQNRLLHYVVTEETDEGTLLFNLLTREVILLSGEEYANLMELDYLKDHWFVVPESSNEKELAEFVRLLLTTRQKKTKNITGYTIFPTTDCNARCFYCFELGRSRIPMTEETAHKVANYIHDHCGGEKVRISWFGGEPLFNKSAIETICADLREMGVEFKSSAVSNGYLFDEETVKKAVNDWNLQKVQITLDGTEAVYNKTKAFIYKGTNPYQTVLTNIGHLLDAEVAVAIRLNMDLYNAEELIRLVDELAERFAGRKDIHVYAHYIFEGNMPMAESHTASEWEEREQAMIRLENRITMHDLAGKGGISKNYRLNYCMADSGKSVTILPNGDIGLCEHFSEDEFIGHIDSNKFDEAMVKSWRQTSPEIPECAACFYYPECIRLEKCANSRVCFAQERNDRLRKTKRAMRNEYDRWWNKSQSEDSDENEIC